MRAHPKVVVVGGGIMGTCSAWHLAEAGADVTLISQEQPKPNDATAHSFGWIGTGASLPSDNPIAFALHLEAINEFSRLQQQLGPLPIGARGALIWWSTEEATASFIAEQQAYGVRMEPMLPNDIVDQEPSLAIRPPLAAWAPNDFAVEPAELASQFIAAAEGLGTKTRRGTVSAIDTANGQVTGVRVGAETVPADVVLLANGYGAHTLTAPLGITLPVSQSPAVLIRLEAKPGLLRHLLCGSGLEVRPRLDGGLSSAADFPENGDSGVGALAEQTALSISQLMGLPEPPKIQSVTAAQRPMTKRGEPLQGFVETVQGLYVSVAHPGITFAPLMGRMATTQIMAS